MQETNFLKKIFNILKQYRLISGTKTQILLIGKLPADMICSNINILGIKLAINKKILVELKYEPVLKKIKNRLNIWRQRDLSLFGRIEIVKTLGISRLIYCMSLLPSPPEMIFKEIDKTIYLFIWKKKPPRIRKQVLNNS